MRGFFNKVIGRLRRGRGKPKSDVQEQKEVVQSGDASAQQPAVEPQATAGQPINIDTTPTTLQPPPTNVAESNRIDSALNSPAVAPSDETSNSRQQQPIKAVLNEGEFGTLADDPGQPLNVGDFGTSGPGQPLDVGDFGTSGPATILATKNTLQIQLVNRTTSGTVFAYITGQAIDSGFALFLLQADGQTPYFPSSPSSIGSNLSANVSIALGPPGSSRTITIPRIAGGRIWFSVDQPLRFFLNPGPALVEPSVTNFSDPSINVFWSFAEFTFNADQLYANISYVDFVGLPVSLTLLTGSGATNTIGGLRASSIDNIASQLSQQSNADGNPNWRNLVVNRNGRNIRILSPNSYITTNNAAFQGYFEPYVNEVWQRYSGSNLNVRTQAVNASGNTSSGQLNLNGEVFNRPSTNDIFSCNSGPFATGADSTRNTIIPVLAAAFNRTTLLRSDTVPADLSTFYGDRITNHYSRIVHANAIDGRGYAFPYDDVNPSGGGGDQSGFVNDGNPQLLTVTVGGGQFS